MKKADAANLWLRRPHYFAVGKPTKQRYCFLPAVFFATVAFAFGDRFAVAFVVGLAAGFAFAVAPVFFGDCFAVVVFVAVDPAAALAVAVRFLGERVAVVFEAAFFGAAFFVAACFVAILVAPVMSGV